MRIEDIATKAEMEKAYVCRMKEGKHIIPVPTIELKPHFSDYLIDPLQSFFKKSSTRRRRLGEKSIVRPVFSYYGKLIIDDSAIKAAAKANLSVASIQPILQEKKMMEIFAKLQEGQRLSDEEIMLLHNHSTASMTERYFSDKQAK